MASLNRNKPKYVKLDRLAPRTHDHNVIVKVLEKQRLNKTETSTAQGRREQVLVGDETGCMYMRAHNEQCEKLAEGETVELYSAKVVMVNDTMRIALDKWGDIKPTTVAIPGEIEKEPNFSDVLYKRVQQAKESSLTRPQLSRHR